MEGNGNLLLKIVTGVLTTAIVGLFVWVWNANTDLKLLAASVAQVIADTEADRKQDIAISKHWKIVSFHRDQINALWHEAGQPPISWPDLD